MANINDTIKALFPADQTVSAIRITDYLHWVSESHAAGNPVLESVLALPPIQRGFVWKPRQIQDLWDSLLRGMPIGSFMVKKFREDEFSASIATHDRKVSTTSKPGFHLMDGQQRTLSMVLGFPGSLNARHRLWVDLSEPGKNGSEFQFRVSTETQPFGYAVDGGRLPLHDRRNARAAWDTAGEDKSTKEMSNALIFRHENVKPWKSEGKRLHYLFEVKELWRQLRENGNQIASWVKTISADIEASGKNDDPEVIKVTDRIEKFGHALLQLEKQWLALIKIPDDRIVHDPGLENPAHDYLTMLFERISLGGTRLAPDDLLFSMIKQSWPEAHNIVEAIHEKVGALMKPTDFVMTAYRLAFLHGQKDDGKMAADDPQPNAQSFHRNLSKLLGKKDQPGSLMQLIGADCNSGRLVKAFELLKNTLKFSGTGDSGIPEAMFPYLDVMLQQVLLHWLLLRDRLQVEVLPERERKEILGFVLYWMACHRDTSSRLEASKRAIKTISEVGVFSFKQIYAALSNETENKPPIFCSLIPLQSPGDLHLRLHANVFRDGTDRAETFFPGYVNLYHEFCSKKHLLLWLQREWLFQERNSSQFKDYLPLAGQDEDNVPYDFDHLVPQSNWSSFQGMNKPVLDEGTNKFNILWARRSLGNSIGNYRVMTSSDNRSRQDKPLEDDFLNTPDKWENYAFQPYPEEIEHWKCASPKEKGYEWNDKRVLAFQRAVESRTLALYKRYYKEAGFEALLN